jgi:hypothetical protein
MYSAASLSRQGKGAALSFLAITDNARKGQGDMRGHHQ